MGVKETGYFCYLDKMPREKADTNGVESLSDTELVALILETGTKEENVMELSSRLLFERGGMVGLFQTDENLESTKGIGKAKKYRLLAIREIMKRLPFEQDEKVKNSEDVYLMARNIFVGMREENLLVLYLGSERKIIRKEVFKGVSTNEISLPLMTILHHAISSFAKGVIICHNHPSGNKEPSEADRYSVLCLKEKLKLANIILLDSFIMTENGYYSFREEKESCLIG